MDSMGKLQQRLDMVQARSRQLSRSSTFAGLTTTVLNWISSIIVISLLLHAFHLATLLSC